VTASKARTAGLERAARAQRARAVTGEYPSAIIERSATVGCNPEIVSTNKDLMDGITRVRLTRCPAYDAVLQDGGQRICAIDESLVAGNCVGGRGSDDRLASGCADEPMLRVRDDPEPGRGSGEPFRQGEEVVGHGARIGYMEPTPARGVGRLDLRDLWLMARLTSQHRPERVGTRDGAAHSTRGLKGQIP